MSNPRQLEVLRDLTRELDLVVFDLECTPPDTIETLLAERARLRRRLDELKRQLEDLCLDLG